MIVTEISVSISKKISKQINKGLWNAWELGYGATADLEDGEDPKETTRYLKRELQAMLSEDLPTSENKGGGSNQTSSRGRIFGTSATLANQYQS